MLPFLAPLIARPIITRAIGLPWLKILPIVAVLSFIGVREVQHWREVRGLIAINATTEKARAAEENARLKAQRLQAQAETLREVAERNRDGLKADLDAQSSQVRQFQKDRTAALKDAELAAVRTLQQERETPLPTPADADALNAALAALAGGQR